MKYLKTYEGIFEKNIKAGEIYKIPNFLHPNINWSSNISIGKVLDKDEYGNVKIKTFIKSSKDVVIMEIHKKHISKKATPEEIEEFQKYEIQAAGQKYNL